MVCSPQNAHTSMNSVERGRWKLVISTSTARKRKPGVMKIEVLPENIPDRVELDVTALKIGDSLHVRDLSIANAKLLTEAELTIATVVPPRAEEVAAPTAEAAAEPAEPELIRKPRAEEEGEGEGEAEAPAQEAKPKAKGKEKEKE